MAPEQIDYIAGAYLAYKKVEKEEETNA